MILPVYAYGQPVLTKKAEEISEDYENLQTLIDDMFETMYNAKGVGLAGPQIGKSIRLFIVDTEQLITEDSKPKIPITGIKKAFINPKVIETVGDLWPYEEGCLSIPGVNGEVDRKVGVKIEYYDRDWNHHVELYEGMEARVILHEYDHVEGILFTEYFKPLKKRLNRRKLDKIRKGKMKVAYPMQYA